MPRWLSHTQVRAVLTQMGYSLLFSEGTHEAYTNGDPTANVFLTLAEDIPVEDLQDQLEAQGLSMDSFHAFLEGL